MEASSAVCPDCGEVDYFNRSRPHQGIGQRIPARLGESSLVQSGRIIATPVLGGLHHNYSPVAYPN